MNEIIVKYLLLKSSGNANASCKELNSLLDNNQNIGPAIAIFDQTSGVNRENKGYLILKCQLNDMEESEEIIGKVKYYISNIFGCSILSNKFVDRERGEKIIAQNEQVVKKSNQHFIKRNTVTPNNLKFFNYKTVFYWKNTTVYFDSILPDQKIKVRMKMFNRNCFIEVPYNELSVQSLQ